MSHQPGWVLPDPNNPNAHQHPHYPRDPQQNTPPYYPYPNQPPPMVGYYPQQVVTTQIPLQPAYQHQPFPAPIQQQPNYQGSQYINDWLYGGEFATYLRNATSFHVKQKVELLEALVGWETNNKYTVKDHAGNKVFYVGEETDVCSRICLGTIRPFILSVKDTRGIDVLRMSRPVDCSCCCGLCCADSVSVTSSRGQLLGSVTQDFSIMVPSLTLNNAAGAPILKLEGPVCPTFLGSCNAVVFRLFSLDGVSVGMISKEWSGLVRELFTDADYFSISFPIDLDPAMKAVCLAALFLIDFRYYEESKHRH